ncbi:MAG: hypothetical protein LKI94_11390 [Sporolactobacillus sp.]|jgi:hypothetical protein|nr:hypothetical protein [Sporolactobacillus sp.]MCI1882778.1 hypothetical protein [Sporolactobacillus sp.]
MARRYKAVLNCFGTAQINHRNPAVIAWWSAALPGFGHMLLNMHLKGNIFFLTEMVINLQSRLNLAIVYTLTGQFKEAGELLDTRLILIYIPFYIFCIWDSYRSTIDVNMICRIVDLKPIKMRAFDMQTLEVCYLDRRIPHAAAIWSLFLPGLGQIYNRRTLNAFTLIFWTIMITYFSRDLQSLLLLAHGQFEQARNVIDMEWALFIPSVCFGSAYDAYIATIEYNQLFMHEQSEYLRREWQRGRPNTTLPGKRRQPIV